MPTNVYLCETEILSDIARKTDQESADYFNWQHVQQLFGVINRSLVECHHVQYLVAADRHFGLTNPDTLMSYATELYFDPQLQKKAYTYITKFISVLIFKDPSMESTKDVIVPNSRHLCLVANYLLTMIEGHRISKPRHPSVDYKIKALSHIRDRDIQTVGNSTPKSRHVLYLDNEINTLREGVFNHASKN